MARNLPSIHCGCPDKGLSTSNFHKTQQITALWFNYIKQNKSADQPTILAVVSRQHKAFLTTSQGKHWDLLKLQALDSSLAKNRKNCSATKKESRTNKSIVLPHYLKSSYMAVTTTHTYKPSGTKEDVNAASSLLYIKKLKHHICGPETLCLVLLAPIISQDRNLLKRPAINILSSVEISRNMEQVDGICA